MHGSQQRSLKLACTRRTHADDAASVSLLQWLFAQTRLFPSTIAALIDAAPMLGLSPLFSCYWLALLAALQDPRLKRAGSGVLHGVKPLKALCAVFTRVSPWYVQLARPPAMMDRGPWSYDWAPPMPQLQRELTACVIVTVCLDDADRFPKEADIVQAVGRAEQLRASAAWQQLRIDLARSHDKLDAALTADHVAGLAAILALVASSALDLKPPAALA
jgi:hypothetical protein